MEEAREGIIEKFLRIWLGENISLAEVLSLVFCFSIVEISSTPFHPIIYSFVLVENFGFIQALLYAADVTLIDKDGSFYLYYIFFFTLKLSVVVGLWQSLMAFVCACINLL